MECHEADILQTLLVSAAWLDHEPLAPGPRQASLFEASNAMSPPGLPPEAPMDGAGTITAVGDGVKDFKPG